MEFVDKVAFITGGAIGFGRAFARALGERGASVILADIDISAARETAASLAEAGISALALECDVADEHAVEVAVAESVRRLGGIDILINNAGKHLTKYNQPFGKLPRHEVRALFDVNVMGVVNCTVACQPTMKQRGGGIVVNIASIAANLSSTPYGVSKLAVRGLTLAFATELAADGIRVNAISPGLMATENALDDLPQDFIDDFINNRQLVRRLGRMDDIVEAMLFLCSEKSSFMTGETLRVSGGYPLGFD